MKKILIILASILAYTTILRLGFVYVTGEWTISFSNHWTRMWFLILNFIGIFRIAVMEIAILYASDNETIRKMFK